VREVGLEPTRRKTPDPKSESFEAKKPQRGTFWGFLLQSIWLFSILVYINSYYNEVN